MPQSTTHLYMCQIAIYTFQEAVHTSSSSRTSSLQPSSSSSTSSPQPGHTLCTAQQATLTDNRCDAEGNVRRRVQPQLQAADARAVLKDDLLIMTAPYICTTNRIGKVLGCKSSASCDPSCCPSLEVWGNLSPADRALPDKRKVNPALKRGTPAEYSWK